MSRADGCYPQTKVRHAQAAGAVAVLVVQYRTTPGLLLYYWNGEENDDITIPGVEITYAAGDELLEEMKEGPVYVRVLNGAFLFLRFPAR